jgi:hypothetical protein
MKEMPLDNDFDLAGGLTRPAGQASTTVPDSGRTDGEGWIAATKGGAEIHADLKKTLTELADEQGGYRASVDGAKLREHLYPTYVQQVVWRAIKFGTDFLDWEPYLVREHRTR